MYVTNDLSARMGSNCPQSGLAESSRPVDDGNGELAFALSSWQEWLSQSTLCAVDPDEAASCTLEQVKINLKAMEDMRKLNLEVELLQTRGIAVPNASANNESNEQSALWHKCCCSACLLSGKGECGFTTNDVRLKIQGFFVKPCITCGAPTCPKHTSKLKLSASPQLNPVCTDCERLFTLHFVVDVLTASPAERPTLISRLVAAYNRSWTLFQLYYVHYNAAFNEDCHMLADALHESQIQCHQLDVGGSSAGVLSGALGIAAAATVAVPVVGTPLLIASLILGGGAAAVQTTNHILHQHHFEPYQRACHILSLHSILQSILKVVQTLRDALVHDQIRTSAVPLVDVEPLSELRRDHTQQALINGFAVGRCSLAGVELVTAITAADASGVAGATLVADVLPAANLARFAGGALSAATVLVEAHVLTSNLQALRNGSPCAMAEALRTLDGRFPTAQRLNSECQSYLQSLARRERVLTELEVKCILLELAAQEGSVRDVPQESVSEGDSTPPPVSNDSPSPKSRRKESTRHGPQSLRKRIEHYIQQRPPSSGTTVGSMDESLSSGSDEDHSSSSRDEDDSLSLTSTSSVSSLPPPSVRVKQPLRERIERHKRTQAEAG